MKQKKNMKTLLLSALLVLMLTTLTACGGDSTSTSGSTSEDKTSSASTEASTEAPEAVSEESVSSETETVSTEEVQENAQFFLGKLEGQTYTNEYLNLTVELDSNWTYSTADELQNLPDQVWEMMDGSQLASYMQTVPQIIDVQAINYADNSTFNIVFVKPSTAEATYLAALNDEEVIDELLKQQDILISTYAMAGIEVLDLSPKKVTFLGEERTALYASCLAAGSDYYMIQIPDYRLGDYGSTITVCAFSESQLEELLSLFKPIE
ncbi:MAG: hypothetical protein IJP31_03065 [Lachnospiraceae bacterium]|nr:hypothetical protein [Lachnospiraceae bacterium]